MKVIFTQGLPASGKSTWAKDYCKNNHNWIRVNRDDLRHMRGQYWIPKQEELITDWEHNCIINALDRGFNVIVDATNFNIKYLDNLKRIITLKHLVDFEIKFFDITLEEAIKRDLERCNSVGEKSY